MSSPYQVLDNRPIDQWRVTELKEELKRRKLTTKGLKEDLVRRLDEVLRNERENAKEDVENGFDHPSSPEAVNKAADEGLHVGQTDNEHVVISPDRNRKVDNATIPVDIDDSVATMVQRKDLVEMPGATMIDKKQYIDAISVETCTIVGENVVSEIAQSRQEEQNNGSQKESGASKAQLEEDPKSTRDDVLLKSSDPNNQVSEVSPDLGFQVKSDSISPDSVSINEKNELKDNIIADNVKLDLEVIKPEMLEPSSSSTVPDGGEMHPMDVEEPHEKNVPVEEADNNCSENMDLNKNDSADMVSSEKLNLDRSSGDDSMEEDVLENKQIDSKYNCDEVREKGEQTDVPVAKEEVRVNVMDIVPSADNKEIHVETKDRTVAPPEKRKLPVGNIEPMKRQRRWNAESLKAPEPQNTNLSPSTTPKDAFQATTSKKNFSRSDSTVSEDAPKERVVPPSPKPPTNSLRIDHFLRPFTLKAVQELLGKTGSVNSFWMDHIKTHCYVSYASVEEAIETRNAVYNLQWPPNGGRLLVAEFVDPQEVKTRVEAPQAPAASVNNVGPAVSPPPPPLAKQPQPQPPLRKQAVQQELPPPPPLPPRPPLSNPPHTRERLPLPPPPPLPEKTDPPIVTLDDLFQKTKATPRIYYLPLSEEQVAAKLKAQGKSTKQ